MTKFQPLRNQNLRTKAQILNKFEEYCLKEKILTIEDKLSEQELLILLNEFLYETEEINGVLCATNRAWWIWINIVIDIEPTTKKKIWNNFIQDLFQDIEHHRYTAVLASRGTGKTYALCLYSLFKMYLFDFTNIVFASNIPRMCKRAVRKAKQIVDSNELLLEKKGLEKKKDLIWSQDQFEYNEGLFETVSLGSIVRSAHVNYVIADDLLKDDNRCSTEEVDNFVFGQLFPIAQRFKARFVISGTPLHTKDLYHDVMNEKPNFMGRRLSNGLFSYRGFYCKEYRIISDWETKQIYLPDLFTWWELADERNPQSMLVTQGQSKFMREYMLVCTDESTTMFPESLLKRCTSDYKYLEHAELPTQGEPPKEYIIGVDCAVAGEASSDNSAFVVLEILKTEHGMKKIIRHVTAIKGMAISGTKTKEGQILDMGQVETIQDLSRRFNNALCIVEKNNVGVAFIQELQKRNVNVDEFITSRSNRDNMLRYLVSEFKSGNLFFVEDCPEIRDLKRELLNFGVKMGRTGKERMTALSGHDDRVFALAIVNYAANNLSHTTFISMENLYTRRRA